MTFLCGWGQTSRDFVAGRRGRSGYRNEQSHGDRGDEKGRQLTSVKGRRVLLLTPSVSEPAEDRRQQGSGAAENS